MSEEIELYKYNDNLCFTVEIDDLSFDRIVTFICPKHKCRFSVKQLANGHIHTAFECPICERGANYSRYESKDSVETLEEKALSLLDQRKLSKAKLIRLDDYYTPELKIGNFLKESKNYFASTEIKKDIDGDTVVIIYIGHKGEKEKIQFFIKPEKLQLSHDHKDLDPSKILAKIELTLRDRIITQEYD